MSSRPTSSGYRDKTSRLLSKAYESANSLAKEHSGQNRGIAAGTAAAFLSMGLDKLNHENSEYSEAEIEAIREMAESASDEHSKKLGQHHFMDKLLEKMVKHTMADGTADTEALEERILDKSRTSRPALSIRILTSNFKKLSSKMTGFFALQYGIIHIITWKNPSKTLCFLFAYTSICMWPHLVLAYPLIFLIAGVLIPGYVYCHPMNDYEFIKVKKRGQSIWDFFTDSSSTSIIDDLVSDEYLERLEEKENMLHPVSSRSSDSSLMFPSPSNTSRPSGSTINTPQEFEMHQEKKQSNKRVKSQMNLLMNMRDLQNLTTDLLKGMDKAEILWYDLACFKDEKLSTLIFYGLIIATTIIVVLGRYIPWRLIFIQTGWSTIVLCHPQTKKYLVAMKAKKKKQAPPLPPRSNEPENKEAKEVKGKGPFERKDIIVDDPPEVRLVEIFELQCRSPVGGGYEFYNYSTKLFDVRDHIRLSGKRPIGVDHLSKVSPPKDWRFELSFANTWTIDKDPHEFLVHRGMVNKEVFDIREGEDEGWIYDNSLAVPDLDYTFRRRRLYRECFRYGREPKRPDT